jgi:hypothetical protein
VHGRFADTFVGDLPVYPWAICRCLRGRSADEFADDLPPAASRCAAGRFGSIDMLESAPSGLDRLTRRMPARATNARCIGCNGRRPGDAQKEDSLSATPLLSWKFSLRAAPECWRRALIRKVQYSPADAGASPSGRRPPPCVNSARSRQVPVRRRAFRAALPGAVRSA